MSLPRPAQRRKAWTLFKRMRAGEFEDGRMTLRARIDLASGNFNMRDPVIYRINHAEASQDRKRMVHLSHV